jgi:DNA-binding NarL/FixJ family response regulator
VKTQGLTDRQLQVARLIADGLPDKEIARRLHIEEQTVRFHVWRITRVWRLSDQLNIRVQITNRLTKPAA